MSVTSSSLVASTFVNNLKSGDLVETRKSFSKAPGYDESRSILEELSADLSKRKLVIPFFTTMFRLLADDHSADLAEIIQSHELSAKHDELAGILIDKLTTISKFESPKALVDGKTTTSSFIYNHNRKIRSLTMSYVPDLKSKSISQIKLDCAEPITSYSGDVAIESKLEQALNEIWASHSKQLLLGNDDAPIQTMM
ncbi:MAG: hypothetical protein HOA17_00035 [Candidatus Melainabacteria bacterium]|jgi:hypothetical protein|nr:hypothetical protein [Candidatus Melainabacteria bacterium]